MTVKVKAGTQRNACKMGVHLLKPSDQQIEAAIEYAESKGWPAVFVHRNQSRTCKIKRSRREE